MFRNFLSSIAQKKSFLMFFTCIIYIIGLFAYFTDNAVLGSALITILGIFAIVKNYLSPKLILFWYFVFFFAFFNASLRIKNTDELYQIAPQNDTAIQGQIVSIPNKSGEKSKFLFNVNEINYNGKNQKIKAKILVSIQAENLNIGDFYQFKGKLRTPFEATNPSQFDYGKYLKNFDTFTLFHGDKYTKLKDDLSFRWRFLQKLSNIRNDIIKTHAKYLKSPNLELLGGVVFGDDAIATPEELKNSFQRSGLLHLLAASGMNVALIYGIWFFILRKLRVPFNISVSSGIFAIIFYALMTGLGPSVIRAAFMLIFILLGKLIDRDAHSISLLTFVALLMLIYNPAYINDVSFQLSFIVTFGLLITAPIIMEKVKRKKEKENLSFLNQIYIFFLGIIFIPIIAQIWIAPIQMYYFNSFSLYSIFANIIILPFVTIVSFGGFISVVLALIKPIASQVCLIFDFILNPVLNILVAISNYFASLPHSLIQMPQPTGLQIFLYYIIVLLFILLLKIGQNKKVILTTVLLVAILGFSCIKIPDKKLETIVFDVKNADAILIKTPADKYFIIDSGKMSYKGGKTQAQMIILSYLKDKGIKNIEALIITHFDSDHAGGAVDLINSLNIKTIYVNSLNDKSPLAQKIYFAGKDKIMLAKDNEIIYNENNLTIKNFVSNFKGKEFENENSIITLVSSGDFDELFMGDAGILAFEKIRKNFSEKVEILKVGHHGAKNVVNKEMLDTINPEVAIISTGINNYGHPNGVTLSLLEQYQCIRENEKGKSKQQNIKVMRTDRENAIRIVENENNLYSVYSYDKIWIKN